MHVKQFPSSGSDNEAPAIDFSTIGSVEEGCEKLAAFLGLEEPVSRDVFLSAVEDSTYAANLHVARTEPSFLRHVLGQPTRSWNELRQKPPSKPQERSNGELLTRAAKSLFRWTRKGFKRVDEVTFRRRLAACRACPHHVRKPAKVLYAVAGALLSKDEREQRICDLCGCLAATKARFEHESCPDRHPVDGELTRWGEPCRG